MLLLLGLLLTTFYRLIFSIGCGEPSLPSFKNGTSTNGTSGPIYNGTSLGDEALIYCKWGGWAYNSPYNIRQVNERLWCTEQGWWIDSLGLIGGSLCSPVMLEFEKEVHQSSTAPHADPAKSYSADNALTPASSTLSRTVYEIEPWWVVNLQQDFLVVSVILHSPVGETNMTNVQVSTLNDFNISNPSFMGERQCLLESAEETLYNYDCRVTQLTARWVVVRIVGAEDYLLLSHVQVEGAAMFLNMSWWCNRCDNGAQCYFDIEVNACGCVPSSMLPAATNCGNAIDMCKVENLHEFSCECPAGYTGVFCESNTSQCLSDPCINGGICSNTGDGFLCVCAVDYTGLYCESSVNTCLRQPCENGGSCIDDEKGFLCVCPPKFFGANCQSERTSPCESLPCQNGGSCSDTNDKGFTCACTQEYLGVNCEMQVTKSTTKLLQRIQVEYSLSLYISQLSAYDMLLLCSPSKTVKGPFAVLYKIEGQTEWQVVQEGVPYPGAGQTLSVRIKHLKPETLYAFRIEDTSSQSPVLYAKTRSVPPTPGELTFSQHDSYVTVEWDYLDGDYDRAELMCCHQHSKEEVCLVKRLQKGATHVFVKLEKGNDEGYLISLRFYQGDTLVAMSRQYKYVPVYKPLGDANIYNRGEQAFDDKTAAGVYQGIGTVGLVVALLVMYWFWSEYMNQKKQKTIAKVKEETEVAQAGTSGDQNAGGVLSEGKSSAKHKVRTEETRDDANAGNVVAVAMTPYDPADDYSNFSLLRTEEERGDSNAGNVMAVGMTPYDPDDDYSNFALLGTK